MIEDGLWKISALLICVILLYVVPTYLSYQRQDEIVYHMVTTKVDAFTQKVRETGYIDKPMMTQFLAELSATGYSYDVEIEHLAKNFSDNNGVISVYYDGNYTQDIIAVMEIGERYTCRMGDFFFVKVVNTGTTKTQKIQSLLGVNHKGPRIFIKSGGVVRYGDT